MLSLLYFLIIGLAAGWLAGQFVKGSSFGLVGDLFVGCVGAILGGFLFRIIGLKSTYFIGSLITATVGALVFITILRAIRRNKGMKMTGLD